MLQENSFVSPRIALLEQTLVSGNTAALATFWQEVAEHSTPLIEPIEGDETHCLVTFLWCGNRDTKNVVVFAGPAGWKDPAKNQMTHMLDTDLWYRTYQVRSNLRTIYLLSHNDPLTELAYGVADFGTRIMPDPLNPHPFVFHKDAEDPDDREIVVSIIELPDAPPQPLITPCPEVAQGHVEMYRQRSHILKMNAASGSIRLPDMLQTMNHTLSCSYSTDRHILTSFPLQPF